MVARFSPSGAGQQVSFKTWMAESTFSSSTPTSRVVTPRRKMPPVEAMRVTRKCPSVSTRVTGSESTSLRMAIIIFMAHTPLLRKGRSLELLEPFHRNRKDCRASHCYWHRSRQRDRGTFQRDGKIFNPLAAGFLQCHPHFFLLALWEAHQQCGVAPAQEAAGACQV